MSLELFTIAVLLASLAAGFFGSLTGLGGGVVLIPILVLFFHVDLRYAIGASLIAVVATSSGAAAAFVREGFTNIRVAILLEVATSIGALVGAAVAAHVSKPAIALIFGCVMIYSAVMAAIPRNSARDAAADAAEPDPIATRLRLDGTYPSDGQLIPYRVRRIPAGFGLMFGAGVLSALVGIGSGVIKVLAMDRLMRLPFKVSTTTSNFMIGVTAAASSGVYLHRGQIEPRVCGPVVVGALAGSLIGARVLPRIKTAKLRILFAVLVTVGGLQMIARAWSGAI